MLGDGEKRAMTLLGQRVLPKALFYRRRLCWPPLPIAEMDNCSRVIKYVVLYGARSGSSGFVDMRILDINVVADLTRHNPTAPNPDEYIVYDGSTEGRIEGSSSQVNPATESQLNGLLATIVYEWAAELWPRLLGTFVGGMSGDQLLICFSVDLLGAFQIISFSYSTPLDDGLSESQILAVQTDMPNPIEDLGGPLGIWGASLALYWFALDTLISFGLLSPAGTMIAAAILAFIVLWIGWLFAIDVGVTNGYVSLPEARALTLGFAYGLAGETCLFGVLAAIAVYKARQILETGQSFFSKMKAIAQRWGIISFALKFGILVVTLLVYLKYYNMAVQEVLSPR